MAIFQGPSRTGGLLSFLVLLVLAYLAVRVVAGLLRIVIGAAILAVAIALVINVFRRR